MPREKKTCIARTRRQLVFLINNLRTLGLWIWSSVGIWSTHETVSLRRSFTAFSSSILKENSPESHVGTWACAACFFFCPSVISVFKMQDDKTTSEKDDTTRPQADARRQVHATRSDDKSTRRGDKSTRQDDKSTRRDEKSTRRNDKLTSRDEKSKRRADKLTRRDDNWSVRRGDKSTRRDEVKVTSRRDDYPRFDAIECSWWAQRMSAKEAIWYRDIKKKTKVPTVLQF